MTAPTITPLPPAPVRSDAPADFATKADAFAAALPGLVDEINESTAFVDGRATSAESSAESAEEAAEAALLARDAAQAVANFKGAWSSLTGPLNLPATVLHNGQIWSLLTDLLDVTASEPGVTGDWLVQGGLDATKVSDFTASRNSRYFLPETVIATLPAIAGMPVGTFVEIWPAQGETPTVQAGAGTQIQTISGAVSSVILDTGDGATFVWGGGSWSCFYSPLLVRAEISAELSNFAGAIMAFARNTAPPGWLKANGALVSRATYADLFAAIGTTFGAGDGSTTFALPDLRGEFVRGWDDGRGVDSGRAYGSAQADDIKSHSHSYTAASSYGITGTGTGAGVGIAGGSTSGSTGGTETRPRNRALLYCIKY